MVHTPLQQVTTGELAAMMAEGFTKVDGAIEKLAIKMEEGFAETREYTDKAVGDLAIMVAKGFEDVNENTKDMLSDLRNEMNVRFIAVDKRIDNLGYKVDRLEMKVDGLEEKTDKGFEAIKGVLKGFGARIVRLEEKVG